MIADTGLKKSFDHGETTPWSYSTVCTHSLLLLLTGVQEYLTLDISIDTVVFACNKIKSVLSIEHTYGIASHCKSYTHSDSL